MEDSFKETDDKINNLCHFNCSCHPVYYSPQYAETSPFSQCNYVYHFDMLGFLTCKMRKKHFTRFILYFSERKYYNCFTFSEKKSEIVSTREVK